MLDNQNRSCFRKNNRHHHVGMRYGVLTMALLLSTVDYADSSDSVPAPQGGPVAIAIPITNPPTPPPSQQATPPPTRSPSAPPTPPPTSPPTLQPTVAPTLPPTVMPTLPPTMKPTFPPTSSPSASPTPLPTKKPSFAPTFPPTTIAPTSSPSNAPSKVRSAIPSPAPSHFPTAAYSNLPSLFPTTTHPTFVPTHTFYPSQVPSHEPSEFPTTSSPSLSTQYYLEQVTMYFDDCQPLGRSSTITFHRVTGEQIFAELSRQNYGNPLIGLTVGVNIVSQETVITANPSRRLGSGTDDHEGRRLQNSPLKIVFDTSVSLQSLSTDLDMATMIGGAFNSDEDRLVYLSRLQTTGDRAFAAINNMQVEINGVKQEESIPPDRVTGLNIFIIVGAAAGGCAFMIMGILIYCKFRPSQSRRQKELYVYGEKSATQASTDGNGDKRVNTDIFVAPEDDISTLGDPMYAPGGMMLAGLEKDETVADSLISGDYSYVKNYGLAEQARAGPRGRSDTHPSIDDSNIGSNLDVSRTDVSSLAGLAKMDSSMFTDDASFEKQFEHEEHRFAVEAPQGKLGMVIDTPSGGVPVVHAIKESSVLADRVEVGDQLLSVDDEDCTGLTAMQVSKLISQKADQKVRVLTFARTRTRAMSGDITMDG